MRAIVVFMNANDMGAGAAYGIFKKERPTYEEYIKVQKELREAMNSEDIMILNIIPLADED